MSNFGGREGRGVGIGGRGLSIVVNGQVLSGEVLKKYAKQKGLCTICGLYQTHQKKGRFKTRFDPITKKNDKGEYTVYKGYCLQPTCYTSVDQVEQILAGTTIPVHSSSSQHTTRSRMELSEVPLSPGVLLSGRGSVAEAIRRSSNSGSFHSRDSARLTVGSSLTPAFMDSVYSEQKTEEKVAERVDPVVQELEDLASDGISIAFLNKLESKGTEPHILIEGFRLFRYYLTKSQLERPNGVVLGGDSWVKTISSKVDKGINDRHRDVVVSGLACFLTVSVLSEDDRANYKKKIVKRGVVALVLKAMDEFHDDGEVMDVCTGIIESLSRNENDGLNARHPKIAMLIRKLADIIQSQDAGGKEFAVTSLFYLSRQRKKSLDTQKSPADDVRSILTGEGPTTGIVKILQSNSLKPNVGEAGLGLLWMLGDALPITNDLIGAIIALMQRSTAEYAFEAGCGTLANLALNESFPSELGAAAAEAICTGLAGFGIAEEEMAIIALHGICNLLSNPTLRGCIASDHRFMECCLKLMRKHPQNERVVEFGCLSISYAGRDNQSVKESVIKSGGFKLVHERFQEFVTRREDAFEVNEAALCAMGTLSGCPSGAQYIVESGLLSFLQNSFDVENDKDFGFVLQVIMKNARGDRGSGISNSSQAILEQPHLFPRLISEVGSKGEALELLSGLRKLEEPGMVALGNQGFEKLLSMMNEFRDSPDIQEYCCALLADAYFYFPLTSFNAPVQLPDGSEAVIHTDQAMQILHETFCNHRSNAAVQNMVCCAMTNLLSPMCSGSSLRDLDRVWVELFLKDILNAMKFNQDDVNVQKSCVVLFVTLSMLYRQDDLKDLSLRILQVVFESMVRFSADTQFRTVACELLMVLRSDHDCMEFMGSATGIASLLDALEDDNTDVVGPTSSILVSVLRSVYTSSNELMQVHDAISKLISCMTSNKTNPQIQANICAIFECLITFEEYSVLLIAEAGGLLALCEAMRTHGEHVELIQNACRVLSFLVRSADPKSLASVNTALGNCCLGALQNHLENSEVEAAVMDTLCTCCGQDDYFKHILVNDRCIHEIITAMTLQLGSSELVQSGCRLLWILSGYANGRQIICESGGIPAIVNGMMAHNQSTAVIKEGLTALRNLAKEPSSKPMIESAGGETAVKYALWIHCRDPQVIAIALSTLNNIAVDSVTRTVAPMKEDILEVLLVAMRRFSKDELVQKNACFYLKSCSYLPANLAQMSRKRSSLFPLLENASGSFPQHCADHADSIIAKVQRMQ